MSLIILIEWGKSHRSTLLRGLPQKDFVEQKYDQHILKTTVL